MFIFDPFIFRHFKIFDIFQVNKFPIFEVFNDVEIINVENYLRSKSIFKIFFHKHARSSVQVFKCGVEALNYLILFTMGFAIERVHRLK